MLKNKELENYYDKQVGLFLIMICVGIGISIIIGEYAIIVGIILFLLGLYYNFEGKENV